MRMYIIRSQNRWKLNRYVFFATLLGYRGSMRAFLHLFDLFHFLCFVFLA